MRPTSTVIELYCYFRIMARSGSYLRSDHRATRTMRAFEDSLSLFLSARKGAAIFTDTELVGSVDCDLRGRRTAPEIVTSSGSSLDGPALRQVRDMSVAAAWCARSGDSVRLS